MMMMMMMSVHLVNVRDEQVMSVDKVRHIREGGGWGVGGINPPIHHHEKVEAVESDTRNKMR